MMEPIICLTTVLVTLFFLVRATEVHRFKKELTFKCSKACYTFLCSLPNNRCATIEEDKYYNKLKAIWISIESISKYKMIFSFKPLKEECWLNEEQLRFIYGLL